MHGYRRTTTAIDAFSTDRRKLADAIRTVTLGDLVSMKLASGTRHVHRARDLADILDLAEAIPLDKSFTPRVDPAYRADFKRLIEALDRERDERAKRGQ